MNRTLEKKSPIQGNKVPHIDRLRTIYAAHAKKNPHYNRNYTACVLKKERSIFFCDKYKASSITKKSKDES
jgi:hypothetical protein